jgi:predicted flavoprotein YhiN
MFLDILQQQNKPILTNREVSSIDKEGDLFTIHTNQGDFQSTSIVLATGGKGYPQTGASDIGWQIAKSFGHSVTDIYPGLCGIETQNTYPNLSGSSCEATVKILDGSKEITRLE